MKNGKILTFGELLWRVASAAKGAEEPTEGLMQMHPGGAEANVAAALGRWQLPCS